MGWAVIYQHFQFLPPLLFLPHELDESFLRVWIDQEGEYCDEWQENVEVALQGVQVATRALVNRTPADKENFDGGASPVG